MVFLISFNYSTASKTAYQRFRPYFNMDQVQPDDQFELDREGVWVAVSSIFI